MDIAESYRRAVTGDKLAEEQLYGALLVSFRIIVQRRVWDKLDGEEIVQDALMTIFKRSKEIQIESSFSGWAYNVLNNKILDYVKVKKVRNRKMEEYISAEGTPVVPAPDPILRARIKECFGKIHKSHRQHARILNLHFQGYSTDEICRSLNISRNNLYVSLSRARAMLEACLDKEEHDS